MTICPYDWLQLVTWTHTFLCHLHRSASFWHQKNGPAMVCVLKLLYTYLSPSTLKRFGKWNIFFHSSVHLSITYYVPIKPGTVLGSSDKLKTRTSPFIYLIFWWWNETLNISTSIMLNIDESYKEKETSRE